MLVKFMYGSVKGRWNLVIILINFIWIDSGIVRLGEYYLKILWKVIEEVIILSDFIWIDIGIVREYYFEKYFVKVKR